MLAAVMTVGLEQTYLMNFSVPFTYEGDGIYNLISIKRILDGDFNTNFRAGYPFGSLLYDFPNSDRLNILLLKIIGTATDNYVNVHNIYYLLGYSATFITSYYVLNSFGLNKIFALSGAMSFNFLPFHFKRLDHLFYTWYFLIPLVYWLGFKIYKSTGNNKKDFYKILAPSIIIGFLVSSFGVYGALFAILIIFSSGVAGAILNRKYTPLLIAILISISIFLLVLVNLIQSISYRFEHGVNSEVAQRVPQESEIYGLKLMQLILPNPDHRSQFFSEHTKKYNESAPLINENTTSSLGLIGSVGLMIAFCVIIFGLPEGFFTRKLIYISLIILILFLFATVGGLGSAFAYFISPSIRGWNRLSIYIAFGSIACFFIVLQLILQKYNNVGFQWTIKITLASLILLTIFFDQTTERCRECSVRLSNKFKNDADFIRVIEANLPKYSAIYQLPYMAFPEVPPLNKLNAYDLSVGFLNSKTLRWSYGGMKGREGDLFFRDLVKESLDFQLLVIKKLGFAGIYLDRRGYEDNGFDIEKRITFILKSKPTIIHGSGNILFFKFQEVSEVNFKVLPFQDVTQGVLYRSHKLGFQYQAEVRDGIDFWKGKWPSFLVDIDGLSHVESWGRWSDSSSGSPTVRLTFKDRLPGSFKLLVSALAFGPNVGKPIIVKVGNSQQSFIINNNNVDSIYTVYFENVVSNTIEFVPPEPNSPLSLGVSADARKLGIGLLWLRIQ